MVLVVYVVSHFISTELMLITQTDKTQKMMMRAMPSSSSSSSETS